MRKIQGRDLGSPKGHTGLDGGENTLRAEGSIREHVYSMENARLRRSIDAGQHQNAKRKIAISEMIK